MLFGVPVSCIVATIVVAALAAYAYYWFRKYDDLVTEYDEMVDEFNDNYLALEQEQKKRKDFEEGTIALNRELTDVKLSRDRLEQYAQNLLRRLGECQHDLEDAKTFARSLPPAVSPMGEVLQAVRAEKEAERVKTFVPIFRDNDAPNAAEEPCDPFAKAVQTIDSAAQILSQEADTGRMTPEDIVQAELAEPTHIQDTAPLHWCGNCDEERRHNAQATANDGAAS